MLSIWLKFLSCRCALIGSSSVEELSIFWLTSGRSYCLLTQLLLVNRVIL